MQVFRSFHAAILFLAGALTLVTEACSSGGQTAMPTATPEPTPRQSSPYAGVRIIPLGQVITSETAEVTVHGVRLSRDQEGEAPPRGYWWMLFDLEVRNTGPETASFHAVLLDQYNEEYDRDFPPGVSPALDEPLPPGAQVRGEIAFLVTRGGAGSTLFYGLGEDMWALQVGLVDPPPD